MERYANSANPWQVSAGIRVVSSLNRVKQDAMMQADRESGLSWPQIASKHGVSLRTAQRRVNAHRAASIEAGDAVPSINRADDVLGFKVDALAEIQDLLDTQARIAGRLEVIASTSSHESACVAANVRLAEVKERRIAVLQAMGLVPRRLSWWTEAAGAVEVMREFARIIAKHNVADEALNDVLKLAERQVAYATSSPAGRAVSAGANVGGVTIEMG